MYLDNGNKTGKDCSEEELRKLNNLIKDAHLQVIQMNWEKKVKNFINQTNECLHDDVTDIINVS